MHVSGAVGHPGNQLRPAESRVEMCSSALMAVRGCTYPAMWLHARQRVRLSCASVRDARERVCLSRVKVRAALTLCE